MKLSPPVSPGLKKRISLNKGKLSTMKPKLSGKSSSPGISQNLGSLKMKGLGKNNTMFSAGKSVNDEDDCITRH